MCVYVLQTEVSYDYPRDAFLVAAGAAYAPGEQVFISYGAQTNDSLMQVSMCSVLCQAVAVHCCLLPIQCVRLEGSHATAAVSCRWQ